MHEGKVWSTDAILRETKEIVNGVIDQGAIGVDMVSAPFLTIAQIYKIPAVSILAVSDNLITGQMGFINPDYYMAEGMLIQMAMELVKQLEGKIECTFESPLFWPAYIKENVLYVLDETLVPSKLKYIPVKNVKGAVAVIRDMKTRAFGQFLVVLNTFLLEIKDPDQGGFDLKHLQKVAQELNNSRPTFPFAEVTGIILGVAQKASDNGADVRLAVTKTVQGFLAGIRARRLQRVQEIADEIKDEDCVLTHCNVSGELAMAASLAVAKEACEVFCHGNQALYARS